MSIESSAMAEQLLKSTNRQAAARELLNQLPPTGVRSWEVPLAYVIGAAIAVSMYMSGQSAVISSFAGAALLATILAVAAGAETRKLARRLAAVETILLQRTDAA
jgi:hypothetical protein